MLINNLFERIENEWTYLETKKSFNPSKIPFHAIFEKINPIFTIITNNKFGKCNFLYCVKFEFKSKSKFDELSKVLYKGINYSLEQISVNKYICTFKSQENRKVEFSFFLAYFFIQFKNLKFEESLNRTFKYFKEIWSLNNLSKNFQMGLFGELYIFELFIKFFGWQKALDFWKGPDSGLHDFSFKDTLIEVKSTETDPPSIKIDNPSQLFKPETKNLYLNVCFLSIGEGLTIKEKVNKLISDYPSSEEIIFNFEKKLMKTRYFNYLSTHSLLKIKIKKSVYAHISSDNMTFPKAIFDKLPSTVKNIKYHLDFNRLKSLPTKINDWT